MVQKCHCSGIPIKTPKSKSKLIKKHHFFDFPSCILCSSSQGTQELLHLEHSLDFQLECILLQSMTSMNVPLTRSYLRHHVGTPALVAFEVFRGVERQHRQVGQILKVHPARPEGDESVGTDTRRQSFTCYQSKRVERSSSFENSQKVCPNV